MSLEMIEALMERKLAGKRQRITEGRKPKKPVEVPAEYGGKPDLSGTFGQVLRDELNKKYGFVSTERDGVKGRVDLKLTGEYNNPNGLYHNYPKEWHVIFTGQMDKDDPRVIMYLEYYVWYFKKHTLIYFGKQKRTDMGSMKDPQIVSKIMAGMKKIVARMQKEAQEEIDDFEGKRKERTENYNPDALGTAGTNEDFSLDNVELNIKLLLDSYTVVIPDSKEKIAIEF